MTLKLTDRPSKFKSIHTEEGNWDVIGTTNF